MSSAQSLRILEVTHYMPPHTGGIEFVTESLVCGLRQRGHRVRWIASATPASPGSEHDCIRIPALNILEQKIGLPYPLWHPTGIFQLYQEVQQADVVHIHDCLYLGSVAACWAARATRTPLVITQHVGSVPFGPVLDRVQHAAYRSIGAKVLASADHRVVCSAHVAEFIRQLGVYSPCTHIPNAVNTDRFTTLSASSRAQLRRKWNLPNHQPILLMVGRLVPKKNLHKVLAVLKRLTSWQPRLWVVGNGPDAYQLQNHPQVIHHPHVPAEQMAEVYRCADVFILPSQGEGLPLSVQEAILSGLPTVVSTDPAFRANLQDCPGVYFANSISALADATAAALQTPTSGQTWARSRWHTETFLTNYSNLLQRAHRDAAKSM